MNKDKCEYVARAPPTKRKEKLVSPVLTSLYIQVYNCDILQR